VQFRGVSGCRDGCEAGLYRAQAPGDGKRALMNGESVCRRGHREDDKENKRKTIDNNDLMI
jgi:hypothetical protein